MGTRDLDAALARGAPLADIIVRFRPEADADAVTNQINALAEDLDLHLAPWYNDPALRIGSATKEALERLFDWHLVRVPLERYDETTQSWSVWPDAYRWAERNAPTIPDALRASVEAITLTQPGADDDGQAYEPDTVSGPPGPH